MKQSKQKNNKTISINLGFTNLSELYLITLSIINSRFKNKSTTAKKMSTISNKLPTFLFSIRYSQNSLLLYLLKINLKTWKIHLKNLFKLKFLLSRVLIIKKNVIKRRQFNSIWEEMEGNLSILCLFIIK